MLRFTDRTITPPGNSFPYRQIESGHSFKQISFSDLVKVVRDHRQGNNFPIGPNFEAEVEDNSCRQLLQMYPDYNGCENEEGMIAKPSGKPITLQDIIKFLHFAIKWLSGGGKFVSQEEAERRAKICLKCPLHVDTGVCNGCNGISALVRQFKGDRRVEDEEHLKVCGACHCFLRVKVWMPIEPMKRDDVEWSSICWMREDEESSKGD